MTQVIPDHTPEVIVTMWKRGPILGQVICLAMSQYGEAEEFTIRAQNNSEMLQDLRRNV